MSIPNKFFLTTGVGKASISIISFAKALEDAGCGKCNIVKVSSVIPPHCEFIPKEDGIKLLSAGQITYSVLAQISTNNEEIIAAAVGGVIPQNSDEHGYLFELVGRGEDKETLGKKAENLSIDYLSNIMGKKVGKSFYIAENAKGEKNLWTTVVAMAIFI